MSKREDDKTLDDLKPPPIEIEIAVEDEPAVERKQAVEGKAAKPERGDEKSGEFKLPKQQPRRFRLRVFFYIVTLSLVTSVLSGSTYYSRQKKFIEHDRAMRAHTLLTSLATQAELGAYAGDAGLCDLPARRTFNEPDVVLVGIYDAKGKEILAVARPAIGTPPPVPIGRLGDMLVDPDARPLRLPAGGYEDLWAPIVTSARAAAVAVSSEPGGALSRREVVGVARVGLSLKPAKEQLDEVLATGVYLAAGLLLLGALAAYLIAGRISDPILELARGADEIRAGNLDVRIHVTSKDELGTLAESFNKMAAQLRETMLKLESLNKNLEHEVERRTDEIRRSAEFTEILNAPIHGDTDDASAEQPPELRKLLDDALESLVNATGVRGAAVLLPWEEAVDFELQVAASHGGEARAFGAMPSHFQVSMGKPIVEHTRAVVPVLFRGRPEGALVLIADSVEKHAVEFAARAAGPLAIAISNARAYTTLQHLAHELTERNKALIEQRDQLQEMNRLKSEFLANVSHELRTPLNAISGYTELIHEGVYGVTTEEQREALVGIEESSRNLLTLINQILDLSKVESGKVELYVTEVQVHEVVHAVVSEAQPLAKDRPYRVAARCPSRVAVRTDAAKLKQILTNLVSNAIKFTEKGGVSVELRASDDGGCAIAVRDTGIGIRPEDQSLIFEEFRQVDGSSTRKFSGTGLGLAIARRFAALLGGTITVESAVTVGSTFTLRLPPAVGAIKPQAPPRRITGKIQIIPPPIPGGKLR